MKPQEVDITFQPSGRRVYVLPGTKILEAAGRAGIILQTPCGGRGTCGKCRVQVISGPCGEAADSGPLSGELAAEGYRLACQTEVQGPAVINVPSESMFEHRQQILVSDSGNAGNFNPATRKVFFELAAPSAADVRSDLARLHDAIGDDVSISPDMVRMLPGFLRAQEWRGTAVVSGDRLIGVEAGNTADSACGVALDIGTTTVVGTLFDLIGGKEMAVASSVNKQVAYGDDVISRIRRVREDRGALNVLQNAIVETINDLIEQLVAQTGIPVSRVYELVAAGNSTMQQILCGFDPSALGELPFVQVFDKAQVLPVSRLGLKAHPGADIYVFPQVGGFVGGDTVAGVTAARLDRWDKPVLFVDIGTNGEIVLAHDGSMLATSTAAGPAFEGARIRQGMRATAGAVEKVIIAEDVVLNVIGNIRPAGLCGTALIDLTAELLRMGIIDGTGRILPAEELSGEVPDAVRKRLVAEDGDMRFMLADAGETLSGEPLYLWQRDVRELQLAAGAIRAGIRILLRRANLRAEDLGAVLLAGAFGNFIRRRNARRIGLLPQIACERIRFIGNAASLGAKMVLLSADERRYASEARHLIEHVDLSQDADFQTEFGNAMLFPDGDVDACA